MGVDSQSLQQLVTSCPWSDDRVWRAIRQEVIPHLEPLEAWIVDETGWLKQGQHSVGVSHQYCGAVGKQANCRVSVELAVSDGWVAAPLGGQLYLPQSWTQDRERCTQVGVPEEVPFRSKPELGLELIRQALDDGVPPAPVLGDCVYGDSPEFREGVRQLGMEFFCKRVANTRLGPIPSRPNESGYGAVPGEDDGFGRRLGAEAGRGDPCNNQE